MPKKRNNSNNPRGRGTGGSPGGRGRGNGRGAYSTTPRFRGIGRSFPDFYDDDFDFPVQIWSNEQNNTGFPGSASTHGSAGRGRGGGRGRGRGRGQGPAQIPDQSSRGMGRGGSMTPSSPTPGRGRGRDRGRGNPQTPQRSGLRFGRDAPLSKLLYEDRPYLRPIFFVKSQHTLFQQEEELLQPVNEEIGDDEASHVPTADRVARVFGASGANAREEDRSSSEDEEDEKLEEIDFADLASFKAKVVREAKELAAMADQKQSSMIVEETFTGFYMDATPTFPGTSPEPKVLTSHTAEMAQPLGVEMDEEEVIVYVAPHPRTGRTRSSSLVKAAASQPHVQESHHDPMDAQNSEEKDKDLSVQSVDSAPTSTHTPTVALPPSNSITDPTLTSTTAAEDSSQAQPPQPSGLSTVERPTSPHMSPELPTVALDKDRARSNMTTNAKTTLEASEIPREEIPAPALPVAPEFSSISFSFASSSVVATAATTSTSARGTDTPTSARTPSRPAIPIGHRAKKAKVKQRQREARVLRRKAERRGGFGSFGAIVAEAALYSGDEGGGNDPRWEERRRGDSDVDWGDEDEEDGRGKMEGEVDVDGLSTGLEGMDIDPDVGSMQGFLESMRANQGRHVTMDDIADEARMRKEDEEEDNGSGSSSEEDDDELREDVDIVLAVHQAERMEIGEFSDEEEDNDEDSESEEDEDEDDGDIDLTPNASFEARLARLREQSRKGGSFKKRQPAADLLDDDDDNDDEGFPSWAEADDDFYDQIQSILDAEMEDIGDIDSRQRRKERNRIFRAVQDGAFDDIENIGLDMFPQARRQKDKVKHLPADLAAQWERDRQKKAERKRQRRLDQLAEAADPLTRKKGGKKGRKAMLAAADPSSIDVAGLSNRVTDLVSVEVQIRRFVDDIGGRKQEMVLPPMEKGARKVVHELALAFGLKSVSKGKGNGRYTTLIKTTRTGVGVREGKIRGIMKRSGAGGSAYDTPGNKEKGKGKAGVVPKHREGDEVGKAAPKISASNIGFRMLASMGWSEGDLIGATADGLAAPLTAIIKNTKLGLGATR